MDESSIGVIAAISAVVASAVGGVFALGGLVIQERLAERRTGHQRRYEETRELDRRRLARRVEVMVETKNATDAIYTLLSTWGFGDDREILRSAQLESGPTRNPRADWLFVDNDEAMFAMLEVTRAIVAAGRGKADWDRHASELLVAYNKMLNALIRQEQRIEDGVEDLPTLSDAGQDAFMQWIPLVERVRLTG